MLVKITGWFVLTWVVIWVLNHPDQANLHIHSAWHAFFGSAGG